MSDRQACGTYLGLRLHFAADEPLCQPCAKLAMTKALEAERRQPPQHPAEPQHIRDLRALIAVLADAMSSKAKT